MTATKSFHKQVAGVPICGVDSAEAVDYAHEVTCLDCLRILNQGPLEPDSYTELEMRDDDQMRLVLRENGTLYVWVPSGTGKDQLAEWLQQMADAFKYGNPNRVY